MENDIKDLGDSIKRPNILVLGIFKSMEKKEWFRKSIQWTISRKFLKFREQDTQELEICRDTNSHN